MSDSQPETPSHQLAPPVAPTRPYIRTHHGDAVQDPYAWMRDVEDPCLLYTSDAADE